MNKGKEQSFEKMWTSAVFELYNVANAQDFERLEQDVAAGKLTKEAFVTKIIECESRAAEKTRLSTCTYSCLGQENNTRQPIRNHGTLPADQIPGRTFFCHV